MGFDIATIGQDAAGQAAQGAIGGALGLILQKHNDQRQINQQQKLNNMQLQSNEAMTDYNYAKQLNMWKATSYPAQMEQMKAAGLNPALMYGQGGGGGTTTGSGSGGSVSAPSAPQGGREILDISQNMMQQQMLRAQIDNINADTKQKQAETPTTGNTADIKNANITADTAKLNATTQNTEAQTALTKINTSLAQIQQGIQADISEKGYVQQKLEAEIGNLNQQQIAIMNSNWTFSQTKEEVVQNIKQQAANAVISGAAMNAGIKLTNEQIQGIAQQIESSKTGQEEMKASITQKLAQAGLMDKEKSLLLTQTILQGVGAVGNVLGKFKTPAQIDSKTTIHNYNAENSY